MPQPSSHWSGVRSGVCLAHVVTISATYGAGGALVGPAVAERLSVPFGDRAIPVAVADDLGFPLDDVLSSDEQCGGWCGRETGAPHNV